jgi:hypothetical protein
MATIYVFSSMASPRVLNCPWNWTSQSSIKFPFFFFFFLIEHGIDYTKKTGTGNVIFDYFKVLLMRLVPYSNLEFMTDNVKIV